MADGTVRTATASCLGEISGTGYLAPAQASGSACITANISGPVVNYLEPVEETGAHPRSRYCKTWVRIDREQHLPDAPPGKATLTGTYNDLPIVRHVNGINGTACDRALWKMMQPLFTPGTEELIIEYPDGTF